MQIMHLKFSELVNFMPRTQTFLGLEKIIPVYAHCACVNHALIVIKR